jgi:hypothetical protein
MSMREVFELLERLSGKKIPRGKDKYSPDSGLNAKITYAENVVVKLG